MQIIALILGVVTAVSGYFGYMNLTQDELSLGAFSDTFLSIQLAASPANTECLKTDGTDNYWDTCAGGGSTLHVDGGGFVYPQTGDYHSAPKYVATGTAPSTFVNASSTQFTTTGLSWFTGTSTWAAGVHPVMHGIYAGDSSGLHLHSSNGTEVAYFGAGGGANVTLPGYTNAVLTVGATGNVVASTTIASAYIQDSYLLNTGDTATGLMTFSSGYLSSASSTVVGALQVTATATVGALVISDGSVATSTMYFDAGKVTMGSSTLETLLLDFTTANTITLTSFSGVTNFIFDTAIKLTATVGEFLTTLEIPFGTACDSNADGEICHDTSDQQLIMDGAVVRTNQELYQFSIASTSPIFASGQSKRLPVKEDGYTVTDIYCDVEGGTSKLITLYGETIDCDLDGQVDDGSISSATLAASASTTITMGAATGTVNYLNVTVKGTYTRE